MKVSDPNTEEFWPRTCVIFFCIFGWICLAATIGLLIGGIVLIVTEKDIGPALALSAIAPLFLATISWRISVVTNRSLNKRVITMV